MSFTSRPGSGCKPKRPNAPRPGSKGGLKRRWGKRGPRIPPPSDRTREKGSLGVDQQALAVAARGKRERLFQRQVALQLVHPPPAIAAEPFEGAESGLVGHAMGALDPIAEVHVRQAGARRADDVVEDDVGPESLPRVGPDIEAAWTVSDRLAAAEADSAERFVELAGVAAAELSEHLPLNLARQIRARARVGDEEFREAKWCAQPRCLAQMVSRLFMRLVNAEEKTWEAPFSTEGGACPFEGHPDGGEYSGIISRARRVRRGIRQLRVAPRRRRSTPGPEPRIRLRSSCPWPEAG